MYQEDWLEVQADAEPFIMSIALKRAVPGALKQVSVSPLHPFACVHGSRQLWPTSQILGADAQVGSLEKQQRNVSPSRSDRVDSIKKYFSSSNAEIAHRPSDATMTKTLLLPEFLAPLQ